MYAYVSFRVISMGRFILVLYSQGRAEARRKGTDGVLVDSPYAASNGMSKSVDTNGTIKTHSAAWEHKQTKTLPWDGGGAVGIATAAAEGAPKMSAGVCGTGRGVAGRSDGAAAGVRGVLGDESIGGRREGYRLQVRTAVRWEREGLPAKDVTMLCTKRMSRIPPADSIAALPVQNTLFQYAWTNIIA